MTLDLTIEETNFIIQVLGNMPTSSNCWLLLKKINEQAQAQVQPAPTPEETH